MGMFDDINCKYPLPLAGANELAYQTKDTESQFCDIYEIRCDGTLWHEAYDTEDHSALAKWKAANSDQEPPKELSGTMDALLGCMTRANKRWEQVNLTGEIRFDTIYSLDDDGKMTNDNSRDGWVEWSSYFVDGKLNQMHLVVNRVPTSHGRDNK